MPVFKTARFRLNHTGWERSAPPIAPPTSESALFHIAGRNAGRATHADVRARPGGERFDGVDVESLAELAGGGPSDCWPRRPPTRQPSDLNGGRGTPGARGRVPRSPPPEELGRVM